MENARPLLEQLLAVAGRYETDRQTEAGQSGLEAFAGAKDLTDL
jgi:hypothetical protein